MKHRIPISVFCAISAITAMAQSETTDTINTQKLNEVVVEARNQRLGAEVSTYIPTSKQKKRIADCNRFVELYGNSSNQDFSER